MQKSEIKLNKRQSDAVTHEGSPLLIIAGAGTGKTTVITERIKWLIQEKEVVPDKVLALTFTDKAASEMEERVDQALPLGYNRTWIMTFHGFCERVLRQDAIQIGLDSGFDIISEAESQMLIRENLFSFDIDYYRPKGNPAKFIGGMLTHFSRLKDEAITPAEYLEWANGLGNEYEQEEVQKYQELARAYKQFEELKVENSVMDFGDLISNTLQLFIKRPNVLKSYQKQFSYVLLDEFQDSNYAQNHLAILLAGSDQNITAVADDDQSIYRWRGAAVHNVLDFKKHFPTAKVITLVDNYRSNQRILDSSYTLIQHNNPDRLEVQEGLDKKLISHKTTNSANPLGLIWEESVEDEVDRVVEKIISMNEQGVELSEIAILVRANSHVDPFVRGLKQNGVPYQFLGPGKLFMQNEVKELIAYLSFLYNLQDNLALLKVLGMEFMKISPRDLNFLISDARSHHKSLFEVLESVAREEFSDMEKITEDSVAKTQQFVAHVHQQLEDSTEVGVGSLLYQFLEVSGLLQKMSDPETESELAKVENITAFFEIIKKFESRKPDSGLIEFVEYLSYLVRAGESPQSSTTDWNVQDAVNILTVHSSKGLEFDVVFLVNLVDLRFPSTNRKDQIPLAEDIIKEPAPSNDPHVSEERRLFYVGMTRAREQLFLTGAKSYGDSKRKKKLSPFIAEALIGDLETYKVSSKQKQKSLFSLDEFDVHKKNVAVIDEAEQKLEFNVNYLSYSQIESFRTCPLHYKLDYLLKIPTLPNAALSFGNAIHDALRDAYHQMLVGNVQATYSQVHEQAMKRYSSQWTDIGFASKDHAQQRFEDGKKILSLTIDNDLAKEGSIERLEEPFTFNVLEDLRIGGRIDRVDRLPDGRIEIVDYKTGKLPNKSDLKRKELQLSIYALAATSPGVFDFDLDQIILSFYYLEAGEVISYTRTGEELEQARQEIIQVREEIQVSDFKCNGSFLCRDCEYKLFCD